MQTVLTWLRLMRIPAVFSALSNILAAQMIATQGRLQWKMLLLLWACSACLYLGGMVSNDCCDAGEDARDRPGRPIPSGRVSLRQGWIAAGGLFLGGLMFAALAGSLQLIIALTLVTLILLYNGYAKALVIGAPVMGLCRYTNWILGLSVSGLDGNTFYLALPPGLYVMALTLLSREETSAGSRLPLLSCGITMAAAVIVVVALNKIGLLPHSWALVLLGGQAAVMLQRLAAAWRDYTTGSIQHTVTMLLLGIIPFDAVMTFAGAPWWGGVIVLALWYPGRLLARMIQIT